MFSHKVDLLSHLLKHRLRLKGRYSVFRKYSKDFERPTEPKTESEIKGYQFEQYIVSLFNPDYFHLLEWRSDKHVNNIFPLTCQFPDLEFYYRSKTEELHFAVECKWRQYFEHGKLNWAKEAQYGQYKQFQEVSGIPVFVILGVGGSANKPNEVYSIPLQEMEDCTVSCISLTPHLRKSPSEPFFLNISKRTLR